MRQAKRQTVVVLDQMSENVWITRFNQGMNCYQIHEKDGQFVIFKDNVFYGRSRIAAGLPTLEAAIRYLETKEYSE